MMNIKLSFFFFTHETFMGIMSKCPSPIYSRAFSKILIGKICAFKAMKCKLLTCKRTKFRLSTFFRNLFLPTFRALDCFLSSGTLAGVEKASSGTKSSSLVFTPCYIRRALSKRLRTKSTIQMNYSRSRFIVANAGTKFCSIFGKKDLAYRTSFHMSILPLAVANV